MKSSRSVSHVPIRYAIRNLRSLKWLGEDFWNGGDKWIRLDPIRIYLFESHRDAVDFVKARRMEHPRTYFQICQVALHTM